MKVVLLRNQCPDRVSCPRLYSTDQGTYVVQGYANADLACRPGEAVVEVPLTLIPEIAAQSHRDLHVTDHGTVLVRGSKISDREALVDLRLPAGEEAVELAADALPALEVTVDAR